MAAKKEISGLTAIRGIAAWWVVMYHFKEQMPIATDSVLFMILKQGYLAVDLFFEMSGFLMAATYVRTFAVLDKTNYAKFIWFRFARIYPLHIVILLLFIVNPIALHFLSRSTDLPDRYNFHYFILSVALIQNWGFTRSLAWNIPAWSISTEWFAYLFFPPTIYLLNRVLNYVGWLILVAVIMLALAYYSFVSGGLGADIGSFGLLRCVAEFSSGLCLYFIYERGRSNKWFNGDLFTIVVAVLLVLYAAFDIEDGFIIPVCFLVLIAALTDEDALLSRLLNNRPVMYAGLISYSTYLVHYFIKDWVKFLMVRDSDPGVLPTVVFVAITAGASVLLYNGVEVPCRRALRSFGAHLSTFSRKVQT